MAVDMKSGSYAADLHPAKETATDSTPLNSTVTSWPQSLKHFERQGFTLTELHRYFTL